MLNAVRIGYARVVRSGGSNLIGELHLDEEGGVFYLIVPDIGANGAIVAHRKFIFQGIQAELLDDDQFAQELRILARRIERDAAPKTQQIRRTTVDERDILIERLRKELDSNKTFAADPRDEEIARLRSMLAVRRQTEFQEKSQLVAARQLSSQELLIQKELEAREFRAKNPPEELIDPVTAALNPTKYPDPDANSPLMAVGRFVQGVARPGDMGTMEQVHETWTNKEPPTFFRESDDGEIEGGMG